MPHKFPVKYEGSYNHQWGNTTYCSVPAQVSQSLVYPTYDSYDYCVSKSRQHAEKVGGTGNQLQRTHRFSEKN